MKPAAAVAWFAACFVSLQLLVAGLVGLRPGAAFDIVTMGASLAAVYLAGTFGVLRVHAADRPSTSALGLRPSHPALGIIGCALGISVKLPVESLRSATERLAPSSETQLLDRALLYSTDTWPQLVGLVLVACIAAPLVEELFFRGALFGRLLSWSLPGALVTTGLLFVAAHNDVRAWPALLIVAALLGALRVLAGSLLPCLAFHVSFNSLGVLSLALGWSSPTSFEATPLTSVLAAWLVSGLLLWSFVHFSMSEQSLRARKEDEQ